MPSPRVPRPPLAVVALGCILLITAAWWALALVPLAPAAPEWLARTREVCFGATRTGLPHAGGWILLIGEPIGMLAVLFVVWGGELREGLAALHRVRAGRAFSAAVVLVSAAGLVVAARRVAAAMEDAPEPFAVASPLPGRTSRPAPPLRLVDQAGAAAELGDGRGRWLMLTFAFGHCDDICPVIVEQARRARSEAGVAVPLWVVTLDPWRDTPDRLPAIARSWELDAGDRVLSGPVPEVNAVLDGWEVARRRDEATGMILHGSIIVLIDPEGRIAWRIDGGPQRLREALERVAREGAAH